MGRKWRRKKWKNRHNDKLPLMMIILRIFKITSLTS